MAVVYVLDADHGTKIGMSGGDGLQRLAGLRAGSGGGFEVFRVFEFASGREAFAVERLAHKILRQDHKGSEWFWCHPLVAVEAIHRAWRASRIIEAQRHDEGIPVARAANRNLQTSPLFPAPLAAIHAGKPQKAYSPARDLKGGSGWSVP